MKLATQLRSLGRDALAVVFPAACVSCGLEVEANPAGLRHLCARCQPQLHLVHEPHCTTCGQV